MSKNSNTIEVEVVKSEVVLEVDEQKVEVEAKNIKLVESGKGVLYVEQDLTEEQQEQARKNISSASQEDIAELKDTKVDKIDGKGLSTNDYSNEEKQNVAENTFARHEHGNKEVLDETTASYKQEEKEKVSKIIVDGDGKKALMNDGTYGEAGKVDTLSINNNEKIQPDAEKNINIPLNTFLAELIKGVAYTQSNGHLTFTRHNNTSFYIDLPLELIVVAGQYESATKELVLVLANEQEIRIPIGDLLVDMASEEYVNAQIISLQETVNNQVQSLELQIGGKVDKVEGKELSTNDLTNELKLEYDDAVDKKHEHSNKNILDNTQESYTTAEKNKLETLQNYDDSHLTAELNTHITDAEIHITEAERNTWDAKSDFSGDYEDLENKPNIPIKTSDLENDSDFVSDADYTHTDENFTSAEKVKLQNIEENAQKNVQSDWSENNAEKDEFIKNKPTNLATNESVASAISSHNENGTAHNDIRVLIANIISGTTEVAKALESKNYNTTTGSIKEKFDTLISNINELNRKIEAQAGIGGYLQAYDFGADTPTQQQLTDYALSQISNITEQGEIWNGTRVKNLHNGHLWVLTNTPNTTPAVFEWTNNGYDTVTVASNEQLGVVKGGDFVSILNGVMTVLKSQNTEKLGGQLPEYYATLSALTALQNSLTGYYTKSEVDNLFNNIDLSNYISYTQDDVNVGKTFVVGEDGVVELVDFPTISVNGIDYLKDPDKTYLVIKTPADNDTFTLLTGTTGSPNYTIEWGDGASENITTTENPTHEYAKAGMYLITISGDFANGIAVGLSSNVNKNKMIEVYGGTNYPTSIGGRAFDNCTNLTTANFPNATSVGNRAFYKCQNLTTANFPYATSLSTFAFYKCSRLTTANFPNVTSVGNLAFYLCTNLTTANFPNATSIGYGTFGQCESLTTANFPNVTSVGVQGFSDCTNLTTATFPNVTDIELNAFSDCTNLKTLTLGNVTTTETGTRFENVVLDSLTISGNITDTDITRIKTFFTDNGGSFSQSCEIKHGLQVEKTPTLDNDVVRKIDQTATNTTYSNITSGLTANNVQGAIDEISGSVFSGSYDDLTNKPTKTSDFENDGDGTSNFATTSQLPNVQQTTGQSTTAIMSQKAVTDNLNLKANQSDLTSHTGNGSNPHNVTKAQVGLGNVDNTSDQNKPISNAVQAALGTKQDELVSGVNIKTINNTSLLGEGDITISGAGPFLKDPDKTYLVIKTPADSDTFTLLTGDGGSPSYTIEWGDGTSEAVTGIAKPSHEYETAGMYLIAISGDFANGIYTGPNGNVNKEKYIEIYCGTNYPTSLASSAFYDCTNLTTAIFPNVTSIGTNGFDNCTNLTTAIFPRVTSIYNGAFRNCTNLTTANFPRVTVIFSNAFQSCTSLKNLTLGNVTTSSATNAFLSVKLVNLIIAQDVTSTDLDRILQFYADNGGTFTGTETKHGLQVEKIPTADNDVVRKTDLHEVDNSGVKLIGNQTITGIKTFSSPIVGSISGNAETATTANQCAKLQGTDTRSTNAQPQWYFSKAIGFVSEFKQSSVIGLSDSYYCLLLTNVPWSDATGGLPSQVAYMANGNIYKRAGASATVWGAWKRLVADGDSVTFSAINLVV